MTYSSPAWSVPKPVMLNGCIDQLAVPDGLGAVVLDPPDAAGGPVAVEIGPDQVGQARAAVDPAAGERARLAVGVLGGRRQDRVGASLARGDEDVAPLGDAPAVVAPLLDQVNLLPEVLPILADPELARLAVVAQPPGVAQAVGPQLGPGSLAIDERVVLGHAVVPARVGVIDVDPQHGRQQVVESSGRSGRRRSRWSRHPRRRRETRRCRRPGRRRRGRWRATR